MLIVGAHPAQHSFVYHQIRPDVRARSHDHPLPRVGEEAARADSSHTVHGGDGSSQEHEEEPQQHRGGGRASHIGRETQAIPTVA